MSFSQMIGKLSGQPTSYTRKRQYKFGRTTGAGTYGIVKEADLLEPKPSKVAVKIILKKTVKGNEKMVQDELDLLRQLKHPHIIYLIDSFESKDKYYIVTQLATGGELFDRICEQGKFTEKNASQTMKQVFQAVDYLHKKNIVHRDLKPENLLYLTKAPDSPLVLVDFGIAQRMQSDDQVLHTMAGSLGYAAPEIMEKRGHSKPVDCWSLGVITYTLLCGYSPFRTENIPDMIEECRMKVRFEEKYWRNVSDDAKDFILKLIEHDPAKRYTVDQALHHTWLSGETATDHDLSLDVLKATMARAKLRRGIEIVALRQNLERLRQMENANKDEDEDSDIPTAEQFDLENETFLPTSPTSGSLESQSSNRSSPGADPLSPPTRRKPSLGGAGSHLFGRVVEAKMREMKLAEQINGAKEGTSGSS